MLLLWAYSKHLTVSARAGNNADASCLSSIKIPAERLAKSTPTIRYGTRTRVRCACAKQARCFARRWCVRMSVTARPPRSRRASAAQCARPPGAPPQTHYTSVKLSYLWLFQAWSAFSCSISAAASSSSSASRTAGASSRLSLSEVFLFRPLQTKCCFWKICHMLWISLWLCFKFAKGMHGLFGR